MVIRNAFGLWTPLPVRLSEVISVPDAAASLKRLNVHKALADVLTFPYQLK